MQDLEHSLPAPAATGITRADLQLLETINTIVIAAIALFAAFMLINVLIAQTNQRRSELARYQLVGATPRQLLAATATEATALALAVLGLALGLLPSLAATTAYAYARTGTWHIGLLRRHRHRSRGALPPAQRRNRRRNRPPLPTPPRRPQPRAPDPEVSPSHTVIDTEPEEASETNRCARNRRGRGSLRGDQFWTKGARLYVSSSTSRRPARGVVGLSSGQLVMCLQNK